MIFEDNSLDEYCFGIRPGPSFMYCQHERQIIDKIHNTYGIETEDICVLIDFVKRQLPSIFHKDLSNKEKSELRNYFDNTEHKPIDNISFSNKIGDKFVIQDPDLISVIMKYIERRYNFSDEDSDKDFVKLIARTLYNKLVKNSILINRKRKNKEKGPGYDAIIIITLIFSLYAIGLNSPILSENEHDPDSENYTNYLYGKGKHLI